MWYNINREYKDLIYCWSEFVTKAKSLKLTDKPW
nr:MAG TPA: hypothetical protein [Caudoviricetes sp.]